MKTATRERVMELEWAPDARDEGAVMSSKRSEAKGPSITGDDGDERSQARRRIDWTRFMIALR